MKDLLIDSEAVIQVLIVSALESALLGLIVFVLLTLIGRWISPSWRVALWTIPLVRLVVLVLPVFSLNLFPTKDGATLASAATHLNSSFRASSTLCHIALPSFQQSDLKDIQVSAMPKETQSTIPRARFFQLALVAWLGGVTAFAARWLLTSIALRRVLSQGEVPQDSELRRLVDEACRRVKLVRHVRCIVTEKELGPATCGFLSPKIILPRRLADGLTRNELEMVIAHEVEHIRRFDFLLVMIARVAIAMHWYNPLAYYLRRTLKREIELAVDVATIENLGPKRIFDYGNLLVRLVKHPSSALCDVQMVRPGNGFHRRIKMLIGWKKTHWTQRALGAVAACFLVAFGLCKYDSTSANAQENGDSKTASVDVSPAPNAVDVSKTVESGQGQRVIDKTAPRHASGRVLNSEGQPVPNAKLFADVFIDDKTKQSVSAITNENGEFSIAYPVTSRMSETYHTWVYAEGYGVRVVAMSMAFANGGAEHIEIQLPPFESTDFKVLLPNGEPCVDAIATPRYVDVPNGAFEADEPTGLLTFLPENLKPLLSEKTDEQGRVKIGGIPLALLGSIEVITPTYGRQHFRRLGGKYDEPLRLVSPGSISGLLKVETPKPYVGTKVFVTTENGASSEGLAETELDENGRFNIPVIGYGSLQVHLNWDSNHIFHPVDFTRKSVQPNETLKLEIGVRPTIPVTGLILTADTHEPVKGARISYRCPTQRSLIISHHAETDERGRYHTRLIAGEVARQVIAGVSTPYEYPRLEPIQIPAHVEKYEAPEISIHPMHLVKGTLVDHSGAPVLGATVVLHTGSYRHVAGRAETQVDGSFQMRVRSWNLFRKSTSGTLKDRWYWAILDQPAINATPPHLTRLELVNDNPDNFVLRYPKD